MGGRFGGERYPRTTRTAGEAQKIGRSRQGCRVLIRKLPRFVLPFEPPPALGFLAWIDCAAGLGQVVNGPSPTGPGGVAAQLLTA